MLFHVCYRRALRNAMGESMQAGQQMLVKKQRQDGNKIWWHKAFMLFVYGCIGFFKLGVGHLGVLLAWKVLTGALDSSLVLAMGLCVPFFAATWLQETFFKFMLPYVSTNAVRVDDGETSVTRRIPPTLYAYLRHTFEPTATTSGGNTNTLSHAVLHILLSDEHALSDKT